LLVPLQARGPEDFEPIDADKFSRDLAASANTLLDNADLRRTMAKKARKRVEDHFAWSQVAKRTHQFYEELIRAR
jgi:glycosyltransferase involved in cell wall biosynthesis